MGVYITGDTHGNCQRIIEYAQEHCLDAHDTVIVAGDFGCIWDGSMEEARRLDYLSESLDCRLAFVSGNHENFDVLEKRYAGFYSTWAGGRVQNIRSNITHLLRGEMFCIDGKRIFTFGGAKSTDISDGLLQSDDAEKLIKEVLELERQGKQLYRIAHYDWWEQEMPSEEEMKKGISCLEQHNWETDFVITHCCPSSIQAYFSLGLYQPDKLTDYFQVISEKLRFKRWYFGHYHQDKAVSDQFHMVYQNICRIA